MHYFRLCITFVSLAILSAGQHSYGQYSSARAGRVDYYRQVRFIHEAPALLPVLLKDGKTDQVRQFIENWKRSGIPSDELIFSISTLLDIENGNFSMLKLPCDAFYFLEDYAKELKQIDEQNAGFRYYVQITASYSYDATPEAKKILAFTRSWALRLLAVHPLNSTEWFLCRVFSGDIRHPRSACKDDKINYAELNGFQGRVESYNENYFASRRRTTGALTFGVVMGTWLPTGNLKILGVHPSVGLLLGGRDKKNEYDLVWAFRFLSPTPHPYTVLRNDTLSTGSYYDGGYFGFDYTRYIIQKDRFEMGITSAIGYDYFSIADGWGNDNTRVGMTPLNVGSPDFSNGFRLKYFFHHRSVMGLAAKYHLINYCNSGGTDLGGRAFTVDLYYGFN